MTEGDKNSFLESYVNEDMRDKIRQVLSQDVKLGGSESPIAVVTTDIRDYARLTRQHDVLVIVDLLNKYYKVVIDAVAPNLGLINKYIGDRCLVLFNQPALATPDYLNDAATAALQIKKGIQVLNERHIDEPPYPIVVGIGLTAGLTWVGTVGTEQRMEYTIIGKTVNTAFRLAKLPQETRVLTVESVVEALGSEAKKRLLGNVELPDEPKVRVYELL